MTTGEILTQSWKLLGEPSDLNPNTTSGRIYLLQGVNEAIRAVASYKDKVTRQFFRYNQFRDEMYLSYNQFTGTTGSGSTVNTVALNSLPVGETNISGATLSINGENRVIISNTGVTCQVEEPFSNATASQSYTLSLRWVNIPSDVDFIEVLAVENIDNQTQLERAAKDDTYLSTLGETGTPTQWYRIGRRIYFNTCPDSDFNLRAWYYRMPRPVSVDSNIPELPSNFHFPIVVWTTYWGYMWMQEPTEAYAAQRRFENLMRVRVSQFDVKDMMNQSYNLSIRVQ